MAEEDKKSSSSSTTIGTTRPSSTTTTTTTNPRGIPAAPFIDKVETYVTSRSQVENTLRSFQEMISKYQFMELNTQRRAAGLKDKIPEMQRSLDVVRFLQTKSSSQQEQQQTLRTIFSLNDTLYAKADISLPLRDQEVYLWLGANVMLAYPVDEAEALLAEKLQAARRSLDACEEDLGFLREQVTTLEVATARVYNWEVSQKRKEREMAEREGRRGDEDRKTLPNR